MAYSPSGSNWIADHEGWIWIVGLVFTKCGLVWNEVDRMREPRRILTPESIQRECDASLRRLGIERIDLYQFHWPDESGTPVWESWAAMMELVYEGKVDGWIGAASIALTLEDLDEIATAIQRTGAGVGPAQQATALPDKQEVAQ